jgi:N-acetylmuramoyl-L-alanine amidase
MKKILLILTLALFLISCKETVIDYDHYSENYSIADFDSTYVLSEAGSGGRKTVYLNIHCTATKEGHNLKGDWFLDFFKNDRKWDRPGYNEIVELDGNRFVAVPYDLDGYTTWDEVSYGVKGVNSVSINIAYVGGVDKSLTPKDTRTPAQIRTIDEIVHQVKCSLPHVIVMGHREHKGVNKACPSFSVMKEYGDINPIINETMEFDYYPDDYRVDSLK